MLANNPLYTVAFESKIHGIKLYIPVDIASGYHLSRNIAAQAQDIFSQSGATKELTGLFYAQIKQICLESLNSKNFNGFMQINTLMDNLLYRHVYPVDEDCLLRMGAIYTFLEDEDPNLMHDFYTQRKIKLAKGELPAMPADPDMYAFFLSWGRQLTPSYQDISMDTDDTEYFPKRTEMLQTLLPQ